MLEREKDRQGVGSQAQKKFCERVKDDPLEGQFLTSRCIVKNIL